MKKFLFASLFAACAATGLSSCMNGDYDANPDNVIAGNNPLNPTNPTGGGNSNDPSYYSWGGTDPLSAKLDGSAYLATSGTAMDISGIMLIQASDGAKMIQISFASATPANTILDCNSSTSNFISVAPDFTTATGSGGKIFLMENDATHVKGKFFGNLKNTSGGGNLDIAEGYFNINK